MLIRRFIFLFLSNTVYRLLYLNTFLPDQRLYFVISILISLSSSLVKAMFNLGLLTVIFQYFGLLYQLLCLCILSRLVNLLVIFLFNLDEAYTNKPCSLYDCIVGNK